MPLPVTLRAFTLKGHHKKASEYGSTINEKPTASTPRDLRQSITKINLRLSRPVDQRHEHLLLDPHQLLTALFTLGVLPRSPSPGSRS